MKNRTNYPRRKPAAYRRRYPNAADRSYYLDKLSDWVLSGVTACGTVATIVFLFTMA